MNKQFPIHIIDTVDKLAETTFTPSLKGLNASSFVTPFVFCFQNKKVMLSFDKNGWWNPQGGHQENAETIEETVIREAYEEAGVKIKSVTFVGAIKFETLEFRSQKSYKYPRLSYLPIGYAKIGSIDSNWKPMETKMRKLVEFNEALQLLSERTDNNLMLSIYKFIFNEYGKN